MKRFLKALFNLPYVLYLVYRTSLPYLLDIRWWERALVEERGDVNTTTFLADAKQIYGAIQDQINSKAIILNLFKDGSKMGTPINSIGIRGWTFLARLARNWNMGFRAEYAGAGSQPGQQGVGPAGAQGLAQSTVVLKYEYSPQIVTGQAENLTKGASRAFMQAKALEAKYDMEDILSHTNIVMAGAERGGALAQTSASSAGQFTADNTGNLPGALYLHVGMPIDIGPIGGGANSVTGATITAINYATRVVTISAGTPTNGQAVYLSGEAALTTGAFPLTCEGLQSLVSNTGAIQGLDPSVSSQTSWQSFVSAPGAVDISAQLIDELITFVESRGGQPVDMLLISAGQKNKYVSIATANLRYDVTGPGAAVGKKALDLGFQTYNFGGIPMIVDKDLRQDRIFALNSDALRKFEALPLSMADDEAGAWTRITGANGVADAVSGLLRWYFQLGTTQRSAMGVMLGLNVPADFLTLPATLG
jgi:hypothetical protein